MKSRTTAAFTLLAVMVAILLFCSICIVLEAHHDCIGEGCPICANMHLCLNILQGFGAEELQTVLTGAICVSLLIAALRIGKQACVHLTPVTTMVRQNR